MTLAATGFPKYWPRNVKAAMASGLIVVISSDDEPIPELCNKDQTHALIDRDAEEVVYISSSDDDLFVPKRNMKSDPEELPQIRFESREARRHRHRHKHRKRSNENSQNANIGESSTERSVGHLEETSHPSSEPPRIPPLPDQSLFMSDSHKHGNQSSERRPKSQTKKSGSVKKKRQSIEAIKSKEREILGDLFAVDPFKITLVRDTNDKDSWNKSEKKSVGKDPHSRSKEVREQRSRHSSDVSTDGKSPSSEGGHQKLAVKGDGVSNSSQFVKNSTPDVSEQSTTRNLLKNVICETKSAPHVPVHIDDRNKTDQSDMGHHINCSRTGPFDLLAALDKSFKNELENLKVSPRSRNAVKKGVVPLVNLQDPKSLPLLSRKSKSVESSESESDGEKVRRHFMDVFSDISEAESDTSIKTTEDISKKELGNKTLNKKESFVNDKSNVDEGDETLIVSGNVQDKESDVDVEMEVDVDTKTVYSSVKINQNFKHLLLNETSNTRFSHCGKDSLDKRKNYGVKLDEFSDISEDESQKTKANIEIEYNISDVDELDVFVNTPMGGNDYLGNTTLSQTETDADEPSLGIASEKVTSESKTDTAMPVLERAFIKKGDSLVQAFEMPILEKYTEVYSSFRSGLDEQEGLPDIEDDEMEVGDTEMKEPELAHTNIDKPSSQFNESHDTCDNIFTKFSLTPQRSGATSPPETASSFVPFSSGRSTSVFSGMRPCKSDIFLSSPKGCSTPKSRKRKIRKSNTCSSFGSIESCSISSTATSSQIEKLSLTKQMDQLTVYLEDFLRLNDSKVSLPKLPEAQKNIVYGCEEDGLLNLGHALHFIETFCRKYIIPSDLCKDVIKSAFHSECKLSHIHRAYNLLSELNMRRCAEIEMDWETIESCLKIALSTSKGKPYYQLLQATLLLQLGVDVLKMDLYRRELSDTRQIRKTFAYKMFAFDVSTGNRKHLIYFLNQALHAGQCRTGTDGEIFQLPDVLPMLQDLFDLCVDVSSSCVDCANTLAADMVNTYKFLPNLGDKQLLIKSVSSQLLQCKLVQYVLESQYDCNQVLGVAFPDSLEDIIQCFFKVMPLKNPLTPPTTPNEDVFREDDGLFNMFSSEVTEEIALLLYFVVVSYLQVSNDKLYMALRLRVNLPERKKKLRTEDVEELGRMHKHVEDLEHHLRCMTPDLTENTEHYLFLMRCLGDLGQVQQE